MKNIKTKSKQSGVALAVGMILLLIISVIGITSMKSALLQEKMAGGLKNKELADAAAMSLLVEVERWLFNFYSKSNGVALGVSSVYMLDEKSADAIQFSRTRELVDTGLDNSNGSGFSQVGSLDPSNAIGGISINQKFGGILAKEPRFIVEPLIFNASDASNSNTGTNGVGAMGDLVEFNSGSAGSANGSSGSTSGFSQLLLYRVISKATDTTGHMISAFESVISVRIR